eukprot:NODE_676_length_1521_cov_75.086957_g556_i0.p2 GENE.NODE_676_length_1521_cov_75.086957_g556_i0~~NODE_676_length_1521_cov_75.086957_g556_i0.p2  ORF type:complete len:175 (-),score=25.49 NODE_676_length_1521_cov_75.086957_g556_i0:158-682(-)
MVLHPDADLCRRIVKFYLKGAHNKSDARGFYGFNARDGLVLRWFIGPNHIPLDPTYSSFRMGGSLKGIKLFHWHGAWKPWYNKAWRGREVAYLPANMQGHIQFGQAWRMWWHNYEQMHLELWSSGTDSRVICSGEYGGVNASIAAPHTHVWMNRYTQWEYVQRVGIANTTEKKK